MLEEEAEEDEHSLKRRKTPKTTDKTAVEAWCKRNTEESRPQNIKEAWECQATSSKVKIEDLVTDEEEKAADKRHHEDEMSSIETEVDLGSTYTAPNI